MPTWVYIYGFLIALCHCYNVFDKNRLKKHYLLAGEVLDCICSFIIILIAYDFLLIENKSLYATLCLIYSCFWSYHAYRHYFDFEKFKQETHQSDIKLDKKFAEKYGDEYEPSYNFDKTEKQAKVIFIGIIVFTFLFIIPFIYIYLKAIGVV